MHEKLAFLCDLRNSLYELTAKNAARLQIISCEDGCMAVTACTATPGSTERCWSRIAGPCRRRHSNPCTAADIDAPRKVKTFCKALVVLADITQGADATHSTCPAYLGGTASILWSAIVQVGWNRNWSNRCLCLLLTLRKGSRPSQA